MSVEYRVKKIVFNTFRGKNNALKGKKGPKEVDTAFLFVNDLGADYLEMSSFVMSLEDQFDFECQYTKDGELPALATVQDAIDFVISEGGI